MGCTLGFWVKGTLRLPWPHSLLLPLTDHFSVTTADSSKYKTLVWVPPTPKMPSRRKEVQKDLRRGCFPPGPRPPCTRERARSTHTLLPLPTSTPQWHPQGSKVSSALSSPVCLGSPAGWRGPSILLHPRSRAPACGLKVDKGPEMEGKWQREGRGGSAAAEWRRLMRKTGTTRARWAKQKQKLSRKRRINSRHQGARQAYAVQAGNTGTQQCSGEGRGCGRTGGALGLLWAACGPDSSLVFLRVSQNNGVRLVLARKRCTGDEDSTLAGCPRDWSLLEGPEFQTSTSG